jgi:dihydrolipoamide dehydrogenase
MRRCDIAIIGAGTAGLHAYRAADAAGADVLLIERGPGGSLCTAAGCIPSKLLIAAGRGAHAVRGAGKFGVEAPAPRVDGEATMRRVRAVRDKLDAQVRDGYLAIPAERRLHGEARFTGPNTLQVGDETVEASAVIVATGARPQVPPALGPVAALVRTHETISDIAQPPATLAVVGAGPLGIELAQAFARLGTAVTLLDKSDAVGGLFDPEAERCAREALEADMTIRLGVAITAGMEDGRARIGWDGGSVEVDLVLAATGRKPDLAPLELEQAGVDPDSFDPTTRRCGDSNVYLAGDVSGWRPVLHEAARGGTVAGRAAAGLGGSKPLPSLSIAFTEPNLVEVGCAFDALPPGARVGTARADDNARAEIDGDERGLVRLYADGGGRLIGGTIVLTGGEHLGQTLALAIERGMTAAEFAEQAWYHPVLEELLQQAARELAGS